ncbi:hypothetical protein ES332_D13G275400v1 [Gossypium tomentosum]|uniref:Kinesin motor domain-containing protein n=1 Tax=Gossypium tomentosum TaxID=34277 RepID=A0A5D2I2I5_GOSTO|nr:hypothetical protein ES332_D13G275400v1 [Gossypium tomentosum]
MEKGNRQVVVSALQFACTDDVPTNLATVESCSLETLSTLKFAQLAKFIKNNAVVNEDASGDVVAMRLQIQQLKLMDINESPLYVLLNPAINPTQKDLPVTIYESEVITSAEFHPAHCNMLAYSSSKVSIRLIDLRQSALCDYHEMLLSCAEKFSKNTEQSRRETFNVLFGG